jgi:hypothetical protein
MNTSTDNGKTWQDNDSPLGIKGRYSYTLPNLLTKDDTFFVFLHKYRNDARNKTDYLYREFKIDKGYSFRDIEVGRQLSDSEKEKKLKERITSFWTLRMKGQFADTYDYHDPFFREKESKDNFAKFQGNITYNRFKVAEIDIKDNIANVKIDYNFEVKGVKIMGMEVSQEPTDDILIEEWVWIYDNWYRVWKNTFEQKYIEH